MDYRNRFSRLRRNIKTRNDIRKDIKDDIRKDYLKDKLKVFGELTKLVDMFNDTYKRESIELLEKLEEINKDKNKIFKPKMLDYINAGSGYGGSCLPKDVKAINQYLKKKRIKAPLFQSIEDINNEQPSKVIKHFKNKLGNILNMRIAVLGISFKGDSDDIRDSLAIKLLNSLKKRKIKTLYSDEYYEMQGMEKKHDLVKKSDIIIISTPHKVYKKLRIPKHKKVVDIWGITKGSF